MFDKSVWDQVHQIPDEELWSAHQRCKDQLIVFARKRLMGQMQRRGTCQGELRQAEEVLDPEALTIGFARRFVAYKRGDLLLRDAERLVRLLNSTDRPVQIIFAGKAHPKDNSGKEIIRHIIHSSSQPQVRRRVLFLEDYDIDIARFLVRGVDVWLEQPAPADGGQRHQRHEGGRQRRAEPEHPGRLVVRRAISPTAAGSSAPARTTRTRTTRTRSSPRPCTACWRMRWSRCSSSVRPTICRGPGFRG